MQFNDSIPPWLQQGGSPVQSLLAGAQVGSQIANNFANLRRLRLAQNEQDAMMPLKKAEYENALASSALDLAGKKVQQQNELDSKAGMIALNSRLSTIKNWASPEAPSAVREVIRDNPALGLTQAGQFALAKADAMHFMAYEMDQRINADKLRQQEMTDRETSRQKEISARELELEKTRQKGRLEIAKNRPLPNSPVEATRQIPMVEAEMREAETAGNAELYNSLLGQKANLQKIIDQDTAPRGKVQAPSFDIATGQLKAPAADMALTTSNRTLAERVLTQSNVAKTIVDELNRDISMTDIGPVGAIKNTAMNAAGIVMPGVGGSKAQVVQQNIKNLQGSINAMKTADRRGSIAELRAAGELIPKPGFALESAGHARNNLDKLVKNVLIPNARANAAQLGVRPPVWSLTPGDVLSAYKVGESAIVNGLSPTSPEFRSKFLTKTQATRILEFYEANGRKMPNEVLE